MLCKIVVLPGCHDDQSLGDINLVAAVHSTTAHGHTKLNEMIYFFFTHGSVNRVYAG